MIARAIRHQGTAIGLLLIAAAWPAAAQDSVALSIARSDCSRLVRHVPPADVAYQPGVDVRGNPVAPADLDGGVQLAFPDVIVIRIEIDLFDRLGIPADPDLFDADAAIGQVVYRDGRAYFDGQPLQDEAQAELAARCQRILRAQP